MSCGYELSHELSFGVAIRRQTQISKLIFYIISSPEQSSRRAIVLPPASALVFALALALALASASTNVKVLR